LARSRDRRIFSRTDQASETAARVFLSLGSNLGDREQNLRQALAELEKRGVKIVRRSSIYETEPLEVTDQPDFLNLVVEIRTGLSPRALLDTCLETERLLGRKRTVNKGPRTIDIDLLFYGSSVIHEPGLNLPHPRLDQRNFVLTPLAEIAPEFSHPVSGLTAAALLAMSHDGSRVTRAGAAERESGQRNTRGIP